MPPMSKSLNDDLEFDIIGREILPRLIHFSHNNYKAIGLPLPSGLKA